jgi:hypothetical protein
MAAFGTPDPLIRSSTGEPGLSLSGSKIDARIDLVAWHFLEGVPSGPIQVVQFNAPSFTSRPIPARFLSGLAALFSRPELPRFRGQKVLHRSLNGLAELSFRNPFGMTGGDPKHTRAEQVEN